MPTPVLEVRDVRKSFGDVVALDGISFQVEAGELFGLLGPNGAGKTTLLSIVSGLQTADSGEVRILGERFHPGRDDVKKLIGIVPQDLALYGELSPRENLRFFGSLYRIPTTELERRLDKILAAIGLKDRADERAAQFSGGMKRRLNLGIALIHEPRLLLLDEPTTGVDPQSRNRIFEEVRRLNSEGMTVVYTSHYMEEVQSLCPRLGIIDHGKLVACDMLPKLLQTLPGILRFRIPDHSPDFEEQLRRLGDLDRSDGWQELRTPDAKKTLLDLLALLQTSRRELLDLQIEEPNLERVFLHLTGRALRD